MRFMCVSLMIFICNQLYILLIFAQEDEDLQSKRTEGVVYFNDYPFMVRVTPIVEQDVGNEKAEMIFCTGVVIASNYVLTAAHCFHDAKGIKKSAIISYGNPNLPKNISSIDVFIHPDYTPSEIGTVRHADIAVVELFSSIQDDLDISVQTISLGGAWPVNYHLELLPMNCSVVGYGMRNIRDINFTTLFKEDVEVHHSSEGCSCARINSLCCMKPSELFCNGQTGFPLICNMKVYGIHSYNYKQKRCIFKINFYSNPHCIKDLIGTLITFVCPFLDWITDIVEEALITNQPESCRAHITASEPFIIFYLSAIFVFTFNFSS